MSLLKLIFTTLILCVKCSDPPPLIIPGHVTIGVLTELRRRVDANNDGNASECQGPVNGWALQEVASLEWALTTINNQSDSRFNIGLKVYDNCGDKDRIIRESSKLLQDNKEGNSPLLGVIALGSSSLVETTAAFLHAYDIPLVTTQSPAGTGLSDYSNVFTTAPHLYSQIQAVVSVLTRYQRGIGLLGREHRLGVISGCQEALKALKIQTEKSGLTVDAHVLVGRNKTTLAETSLDFIKTKIGFQGTVVVLLEADDVNALARGVFGQILKRSQTRWVFSILDGGSAEGQLDVAKIFEVFPDEIIVEPYSPLLPGLNYHIENALRGNLSVIDPLLPLLQEKKYACRLDTRSHSSGEACVSGEEKTSNLFLSGARATAAIKAVSSLAAAFRLVQIGRCPAQVRCSQVLAQDIHKAMLGGLMKLSYKSHWSSDRLRYTADGRLVSSFIISRVTELGLKQIGKYREDTGVAWIQGKDSSRVSKDNGRDIFFSSSMKERQSFAFDHVQIEEYSTEEGLLEDILLTHQDYLSRTWFFFVLGISCAGIFSAIFVAVYVAIKYCDGAITGSQCLGILLLFGVICVYCSCIVYILPASSMICVLRAWLPNMSLALCFSVLLAKAMQLKASVSIGIGGEVSQTNLYISLVFMLGIQLILTLLGHKSGSADSESWPSVALDGTGMRQCKRHDPTLLITQGYLLFLLIFGIVLGILNRKNKKNYNEGHWLLLISGISAPVIIVWCGITFLAPPSLEAPVSCGVCIVLASLILILLFLPKMKVISFQSKDFNHKRLTSSPSLSTIFPQSDYPSPPPPFCDPPYKPHPTGKGKKMIPSCIGGGNSMSKTNYPFDTSTLISWRDHMQESPCIHRPPAPPPPPPPLVKNSVYYSSGDYCYP